MKPQKRGFIYSIMKGWANKHNNLNDFTHLHSLSWFVGGVLMLGVAAMAWWADYEVLYGIEFNNTHNPTTSNTLSIILASIIQVMILFCGGMAAKLVINGKTDKDNAIQLSIYSLLFLAGMSGTLYLSYNTYSSTSVKGLQALHNTHNTYNTLEEGVLGRYEEDLRDLYVQYQRDSSNIVGIHGEAISGAKSSLMAKLAEKKSKAERGLISWGVFEGKKLKYERSMAGLEAPHIKNKTEDLKNLLSTYTQNLKAIKDRKDRELEGLGDGKEGRLDEVGAGVVLAAEATRGRNIGLNLISFILCVGLLFFARGANKQHPTTPTPKPNLQGVHPLGMMGGVEEVLLGGEGVVNNTPENLNNDVVTPPTPKTTTPIPGSLEANKEDVWEMLEDGSCVVLHVGKKENKWRSKSWVKSQITNRTKKAHTAKTNEARLNNEAWRDLWEKKLALIVMMEEGGV